MDWEKYKTLKVNGFLTFAWVEKLVSEVMSKCWQQLVKSIRVNDLKFGFPKSRFKCKYVF